jgi:hypothetical protein
MCFAVHSLCMHTWPKGIMEAKRYGSGCQLVKVQVCCCASLGGPKIRKYDVRFCASQLHSAPSASYFFPPIVNNISSTLPLPILKHYPPHTTLSYTHCNIRAVLPSSRFPGRASAFLLQVVTVYGRSEAASHMRHTLLAQDTASIHPFSIRRLSSLQL